MKAVLGAKQWRVVEHKASASHWAQHDTSTVGASAGICSIGATKHTPNGASNASLGHSTLRPEEPPVALVWNITMTAHAIGYRCGMKMKSRLDGWETGGPYYWRAPV